MHSSDSTKAASTFWRSVEQAAAGPDGPQSRRAKELLRLRDVARGYRKQWFPKLPVLTIDADDGMGGRSSAKVSKLGGWGQGLSIKIKATRIDPFRWSSEIDRFPEMASTSNDRSLIFGLPIKLNVHGEQLRQFEAELIVLQQMLRAEQWRLSESDENGHGAAKSDLKSWGGWGEWFATHASTVWSRWCEAEDYPFVPVRHSRTDYEEQHECISAFEDPGDDQRLTKFRPSCSQWPMAALRFTRDPVAEGDAPSDEPILTPEVWARWKREQAELSNALANRLGDKTFRLCVDWPEGQQPEIDEVEGGLVVVSMPAIAADIKQSQDITLNFNAGDALQSVESLFTRIDRERGTTLWPEFLQIAADHPQSPKASRIQTALSIDLDDDDSHPEAEPTRIDAGEMEPAPEESSEPEHLVEPELPEPSQSDLRKEEILSDLPQWPENPKSQGKGKRVRCDAFQTEVLEGVIHQLLEAGVIPAEIGRELAPWTGQTSRAIQARIRNMRRGMEVAQEVAA
ncbi:hypothetical protein MITS9509_03490 [Synechococcus sp. MIT S9509]|uniref:hypothetical protein n=1 Tax=Synechococcus sp. MIT S9509 TaxID=1801630 RepID=UPI0007BB5831|nr:hypothetical protein [Synechococcus sp. MIT S9509]KZR86251.1 hypothetical protein MITS9509_03490 [Synechococcus sp. MIT S9509]